MSADIFSCHNLGYVYDSVSSIWWIDTGLLLNIQEHTGQLYNKELIDPKSQY